MTKKRNLTALTLIALAIAISLTFGLMRIRSAQASTTSAVTAALFPSIAAQVPGLNIQYYAIDANNNFYVLSGTTFNRVNTISNINGDTIIGIDYRPANGQ